MNDQIVSIRKIAEMTGLSIATVSHVVNKTRAVSKQSRALVETAIRETGYRPNRAARMLKTKKSNTVALIIPRVEPGRSTNFFFMNVISGVQDTLESQGYDLIVSTYAEKNSDEGNEEDTRAQAAVLSKNWGDGLLIVPGRMRSHSVEAAVASGIPFVLIDRVVEGMELPCVHSDNYDATRKAVRLFYSSGKRRIAFVGGMVSYSTGRDRYLGYLDELRDLGLPRKDALILHDVEYTIESAWEAAGKALAHGADAIFTSNNILTMGVLKHLRDAGISIPGQVGVIGYEDYEWMEIMSPPVTTVRQQSYAMGAIGAEMLLSRMAGTPFSSRQILEAQLIVRESHGTAR